MNPYMYLVVLQHSMDDIPLGLYDTKEKAIDRIKRAGWYPSSTLLRRLELSNCTTPYLMSVVTFKNGQPISREIIRNYEEE